MHLLFEVLHINEGNYYFLINVFIFIYLFSAALGLRCGARASHCNGFSCCGARTLGARAQ